MTRDGVFTATNELDDTSVFSLANELKTRDINSDSTVDYTLTYDRAGKPTWSEAKPDARWRCFEYEDLLKRDKLSLDLFWIKDESLEDSASLPDPDVLAAEIVEDLQDALEQFTGIAAALAGEASAMGRK